MIARISLAALGVVLLSTTCAVPARAERLIASVEKDASTPANRTNYDLVVTVAGPRADMVTRRKERKFGIWVNTDYRQFLKVPTYLALFANRPFNAIATPEVERRQQLGLNNVLLTQR